MKKFYHFRSESTKEWVSTDGKFQERQSRLKHSDLVKYCLSEYPNQKQVQMKKLFILHNCCNYPEYITEHGI